MKPVKLNDVRAISELIEAVPQGIDKITEVTGEVVEAWCFLPYNAPEPVTLAMKVKGDIKWYRNVKPTNLNESVPVTRYQEQTQIQALQVAQMRAAKGQ